jgi:hypothetical protein
MATTSDLWNTPDHDRAVKPDWTEAKSLWYPAISECSVNGKAVDLQRTKIRLIEIRNNGNSTSG